MIPKSTIRLKPHEDIGLEEAKQEFRQEVLDMLKAARSGKKVTIRRDVGNAFLAVGGRYWTDQAADNTSTFAAYTLGQMIRSVIQEETKKGVPFTDDQLVDTFWERTVALGSSTREADARYELADLQDNKGRTIN